ncbi:MAG: hypothetical protein JNG88_15530 [Phycisphaerales bacterium]|nr:hypothetical protein [Phycisphaerales bacterium]
MKKLLLSFGVIGFGLSLAAGCPLTGSLDDLLSGLVGSDKLISDGTYAGKTNALSEWREGGALYWQGQSDADVTATFVQGEMLAPSGYWVDFGDTDTVDRGTLQMSREVYDIIVFDWGYEVDYAVTGTWKNVPLEGEQYVYYEMNADGTISVHDSLELMSLDSHDGGRWSIHTTASGTLAPVGSVSNPNAPSGGILDPHGILDKKSGKLIHPPK